MSKFYEIAKGFVDLALKYVGHWSSIKSLSADENLIISQIVYAAGFTAMDRLVPKKLYEDYLEQCGGRTSARFPINPWCPFAVVDKHGKDMIFATGWLDCTLRRVICWPLLKEDNHHELVQVVIAEIARSIPLKPIQLTSGGDWLMEAPRILNAVGFEFLVDHERDHKSTSTFAGIHQQCNGWLDRKHRKDHDALVCRNCGLNVPFPSSITTYGKLRKFLGSP